MRLEPQRKLVLPGAEGGFEDDTSGGCNRQSPALGAGVDEEDELPAGEGRGQSHMEMNTIPRPAGSPYLAHLTVAGCRSEDVGGPLGEAVALEDQILGVEGRGEVGGCQDRAVGAGPLDAADVMHLCSRDGGKSVEIQIRDKKGAWSEGL